MSARIWKFLSSAKLAAILIASLAALLVLSFLVPQKDIMPADQMAEWLALSPALAWVVLTLSLDHIFTSWWFLVLMGLLALNLTLCTVKRIQRRGRMHSAAPTSTPEHAWRAHVPLGPDALVDELRQVVPSAVVAESESGVTLAIRRGDAGFWGSVLMHAGLIALMVGGVVSAATTFRGEMLLAEGQSVPDAAGSYLSVSALPRMGAGFGDFTVGMKRMTAEYEGNTVVDAVALMHVTEGGAEKDVKARVNYPLKVAGKSFLLQNSGHAVQLTVLSPERQILFDSFVNLANASPQGFTDTVNAGDLAVRLTSRPDASVPLNEPVRRSLAMMDPVVQVELYRNAQPLGAGAIKPGGSQDFEGYTVVIGDVRLWTRFLVRADKGLRIIYLAFAMIVVGIVLRFVDPDRHGFAAVSPAGGGSEVAVWGRTRYSRVPGREQRRLMNRIQTLKEREAE